MIQDLLIHKQRSVLEAAQKINKNAKGIVFVMDDCQKLCGVLTDGDIRRLLIQRCDLETKIEKILGKNFIYAYADEPHEEVIKKLGKTAHVVPIVDRQFKVLDYFEY